MFEFLATQKLANPIAGVAMGGETMWLGKHAIRDPPIGVPGERTAGCKYYCDRQTARHESKWTATERGELNGNQGTLMP